MNAKKLTAFLLTLVMLVSVLSGFSAFAEGEEETPAAVTPDITWYTSEEAGQEYTLTTAAQFLGFLQLIESQKYFDGQTIKLGADIDLTGTMISGKCSTADADFGSLKEGGSFAYFGFMGTLDGQNHKVEGITYDFYPSGARQHDMGLLGSLAEGKTATIKNIALYGDMKPITNSTTPWRSAGLYALSRGTLICENVYNALNVAASAHVGAFLGRTTSDTAVTRFKNCVVAGAISANNTNASQNVGGFAASLGGAEATFENCLVTGSVSQMQSVDRAAGFVCSISATQITFKNNIFAGEIYQKTSKTGRYYAWSVTEANVSKESVNNLYAANPGTSINSGSPKLMPLVTVAEDGTETVTFPEQSEPRYKVTAAQVTGIAAAATLEKYGMTDWVATTEGAPLPATIAEMLAAETVVSTKATDNVTDFYGYQTKVNGETGAIRLVGHVDGLDYEKIIVNYSVLYIDDAENAVEDVTNSVEITTVYTGLSGTNDLYLNTQEDMPYTGEYFFTAVLENIQTELGTICVWVETSYVVDGAEVAGDAHCFFVDWS